MQEIRQAIDGLGKSPLFNLSLASKELFHSNFLEWAIKRHKGFRDAFLRQIAPEIGPVSDGEFEVDREKNNFDLTISIPNIKKAKYQIVIENKVKSLPDEEQLRKYADKLTAAKSKTIAILLSLTKPDFFDANDRFKTASIEWRYFGYQPVLDILKTAGNESDYHAALFDDYCHFMGSLLDLKTALDKLFEQNENALVNPFDGPENQGGALYSELKEIRMHDVFEKWRMIALQKKLKEILRTKIPDVSEKIEISTGFSRGLGLLGISQKKKNRSSVFQIELQRKQLRQVLQKDNAIKSEVFEQADRLLKDGQWFRSANGKELAPCGSEDNLSFCKYGNGFVYRHEPFKDISRIAELAQVLAKINLPDAC